MKRESEIEIFVRGCQLAQVADWLRSIVGPIKAISEKEFSTYIYVPLGRCVVTPKYRNGPFSRIKFELHSNPWCDSFECAKQASSDLGCTVRCLKGKHLQQYSMIDGSPMYVEFDGGLSGSNEPSSVLLWRNGPYISLLDRFLNFRSSLVLLMDNMEMAGTGFGHDDFERR